MNIKSRESDPGAKAKIVFRSGTLRGKVLALERDRVSIGRDPRNDISIHDNIISGFHASIQRDENGQYWIEDHGSKNGTFIRGKRVRRELLRDGDVFCICQMGPEIQFTLGEPSLPSILGSTTATFFRTRSVGQALNELWPGKEEKGGEILSLSGVRRILDYKLEESTRRSRILFLSLAGVFSFFALAALLAIVFITANLESQKNPVTDTARTVSREKASVQGARLIARLEPIYGSLYLSYRENPIGEVEVMNRGDRPLSGCAMTLKFNDQASRFLVEPWKATVPEVPPHSSVRLPVTPKLSTQVLSIQTREVTATFTLSRDDTLVNGGEVLAEISQAVFVHGRNIFSWEKPEGVAAFVDQNDPAVTSFVLAIWGCNPATSRKGFPPPNLVGALTLLTGLAELDFSYLPDPVNPVSERVDWKANDRLSYPDETLLGRSGDCDDLSILCCAVLEAARIPTALVVGSGHVLFMIDSGVRAGSLKETPFDPQTVVAWDGRIWLPMESTEFAKPGASVSSAWSAAWPRRNAIAAGEMKIIDLREAWKIYQPMRPPPDPATLQKIAGASWMSNGLCTRIHAALENLRKFFRTNLDWRVAEVRKDMGNGLEGDLEVGLIYANSGLFEEARGLYERALFGDRVPAGADDLQNRMKKITEEKAVILSNLAICIVQEPRSRQDLDLAAVYQELAIGGFPDEARFERGEMMLRLALIHRLRGDLPMERAWTVKAFGIDTSLELTYRRLVESQGPLSGPEEKVLQYLQKGIRGL